MGTLIISTTPHSRPHRITKSQLSKGCSQEGNQLFSYPGCLFGRVLGKVQERGQHPFFEDITEVQNTDFVPIS